MVCVKDGVLEPLNDGYQTPYQGNVIFHAQHAMATCCRYCVEYWYGIPQGRALSVFEIERLSQITFEYMKKRIELI